jgi:hypothetical protein
VACLVLEKRVTMIYNNSFEPTTYTCPNCHGIFKLGNIICAVLHYGTGCCHYGDESIVKSEEKQMKQEKINKQIKKFLK